MTYFLFADYWWFYLSFTGFIVVLLALDLGVFHRKAHAVSVCICRIDVQTGAISTFVGWNRQEQRDLILPWSL